MRKQAITYLVNDVYRKSLIFKKVSVKGHKDALTRPHTAFNEKELEQMMKYAREKNYLIYSLMLTLFTLTCRV